MTTLQRFTRRAASRAIPTVLSQRFDAEAAAGVSTDYELRVTGPGEVIEDRFHLIIDDGALRVIRRPAPEATAWLSLSLRDMLGLVEGTVLIWELMAAKRLDLGGEPFTALRFPALFRL